MTGVITLEDILEEVIKAEIIDEHDTFVANDSMQKVHKVCTRCHSCTVPLTCTHMSPEISFCADCTCTRYLHSSGGFHVRHPTDSFRLENEQSQAL